MSGTAPDPGGPARDGRDPWWASVGPGGLDEDDPFDAHRSARSGGSGTGASAWDAPDHDVDVDAAADDDWQGVPHSTVDDVLDGLGAVARAAARRAGEGRGAGARPRPGPGKQGHDQACRSCPWCLVTRSLGDARPEVTAHLEQAARHLVAAARAWVDAAEERTGYESIPIDDEEQQL